MGSVGCGDWRGGVRGSVGCGGRRAGGAGAGVVVCGRVVGVVAGVPSACRQAWRGAGAFSAVVDLALKANGV